jgi:hypothetical protein
MFRFTIRDVLWLTLAVAVALGAYFFRPNRATLWEYQIDYNLPRSELNERGKEGWELVGVETAPLQGGLAFYFKRPK